MCLYRVSPSPHVPGLVLTAGHWGDGFATYTIRRCRTDFWAPWRVASEAVFERVRAVEFPQRPSRFRCTFAWPDEANARIALVQTKAREPGTAQWCIEAVEPIDPHANQFIADFALLSSGSRFQLDAPFLAENERIARQYWTGGDAAAPELLIESDLRVIGVLP